MRQKKYNHHFTVNIIIPVLFLSMAVGLFITASCTKEKTEEKVEEITREEKTSEMLFEEEVIINYDSLLVEVMRLEDAIIQTPLNIEARKELVLASYDSQRGIIFTGGRGQPKSGAKSQALALRSAERAAVIEAYRWAAYVLQWRKNPRTPDFGYIEGELPGGRLVLKQVLPDNQVVVLVEVTTPEDL